MNKRLLGRIAATIGLLALCWLLDAAGLVKGGKAAERGATREPAAQRQAVAAQERQAEAPSRLKKAADKATAPSAEDGIDKDGEYYDKAHVAAYIRKFKGKLPKNYITKSRARSLGWQGGPLEPYAPGKAIGGDWFGNYEHKLPEGTYRECDIDTRGRPRGTKRLIYTPHGKDIYYTRDHYETFEKVAPR